MNLSRQTWSWRIQDPQRLVEGRVIDLVRAGIEHTGRGFASRGVRDCELAVAVDGLDERVEGCMAQCGLARVFG